MSFSSPSLLLSFLSVSSLLHPSRPPHLAPYGGGPRLAVATRRRSAPPLARAAVDSRRQSTPCRRSAPLLAATRCRSALRHLLAAHPAAGPGERSPVGVERSRVAGGGAQEEGDGCHDDEREAEGEQERASSTLELRGLTWRRRGRARAARGRGLPSLPLSLHAAAPPVWSAPRRVAAAGRGVAMAALAPAAWRATAGLGATEARRGGGEAARRRVARRAVAERGPSFLPCSSGGPRRQGARAAVRRKRARR